MRAANKHVTCSWVRTPVGDLECVCRLSPKNSSLLNQSSRLSHPHQTRWRTRYGRGVRRFGHYLSNYFSNCFYDNGLYSYYSCYVRAQPSLPSDCRFAPQLSVFWWSNITDHSG